MMKYNFLKCADPVLFSLLDKHIKNEKSTLKMIASENFVSEAVLEATGSILTNKYAEGTPRRRFLEGNEVVDKIEQLAIDRVKALFGCEHANVQPYSGSPANQAVCRALINKGDTMLGLALKDGGHFTHGSGFNYSGQDYNTIHYHVDERTGLINYELMEQIVDSNRPKLIWIGCTAYSRALDYETVARIAKKVKAYLVADISHISGLVAGGAHPSPVPHCHVVTSTTHKTFRGPRGGIIMCKIEDEYCKEYRTAEERESSLADRIDRSVFPGIQGGPHINAIAALAVALHEANSDKYRAYARQIVANARVLAIELMRCGILVVTGGTDNHTLLLDFRHSTFTGKKIAKALAKSGIIANCNLVPGDNRSALVTSGIRLGTAALTTMGMEEPEMKVIAGLLYKVISNMNDEDVYKEVSSEVALLCAKYTLPGYDI